MSNLSNKDILSMIKSGEIDVAKGRELLKNNIKKNDSIIYFNNQWILSEDIKESERFSTDRIILFDINEELYEEIQKNEKEKSVILVKAGNGFRNIKNNVYEINPKELEDYKYLLKSINIDTLKSTSIIHLWSQNKFIDNKDDINESMDKGAISTFLLIKALLNNKIKSEVSILYVYFSEDNLENPQYSSTIGLLKTLRQEDPRIKEKSIKISHSNKDLLKIIRDESNIEVDKGIEVKYENGGRYSKELIEVEKNISSIYTYAEGGTYIITGGAGGLALIIAEHIAKKAKSNIILLGRSELKESGIKKINKLKEIAANVEYYVSNVNNENEVKEVFEKILEKYKSINGIIHGAGVIRDEFLIKKTKEQFVEILNPKVTGLINIINISKDLELDFFVTFSSIAAVLGNVAQADYATGNCFMDDCMAYYEKNPKWKKTMSINWPFWKDGGMRLSDGNIKYIRNKYGMLSLETIDGLMAFDYALGSKFNEILVVEAEREKLSNYIPNLKIKPIEKSENLLTEEEIYSKVEQLIKEKLSQGIGIDVKKINVNINWENYGIDSVKIIDITNELEGVFGKLSKTLFFEYENVKSLSTYFLENYKETIINKLFNKAMVVEKSVVKKKSKIDSIYSNNSHDEEIAIIGVAGKYPDADNLDELWSNLLNSKDSIIEIPPERWDKSRTKGKWGSFINNFDAFDSLFFKISPKEATIMDPMERVFLEVVWEAIENASYTREKLADSKIGVFVGAMYSHYELCGVTEFEKTGKAVAASCLANISNRVSYFFDFKGPSLTIDTMCSSSLTALHLACESIKSGECDYAIVGGVNLSLHPYKYAVLDERRFTSNDGKCRSFGEGGEGYVPGEGVGAILLKRVKKNNEDGDYIYSIIKSTAINHGGTVTGYTVPNPNAQAESLKTVFRKADINPKTISYIEAHGTGTSLGDPIEITGLTKAFREYTNENCFCSIGSIKSNIGHLEAASGMASITKVLLQMKNKKLVPSINSEVLNKNINFEETPFVVQHKVESWNGVDLPTKKDCLRAVVAAFGAGGSNVHVILENFENNIYSHKQSKYLIILSAKNNERLKEQAKKIFKYINGKSIRFNSEHELLSRLSYTLQTGRESMESRIAFIIDNLEDLNMYLQGYINGNKEIKGMYYGNVNIHDSIEVDSKMEEDLLEYFKSRKYSEIAKLWCYGVSIKWNDFYRDIRITPMQLPTYPFKKTRYWFEKKDEDASNRINQVNMIHPFIDSNISTFDSQCFKTKLTKESNIINNYVVNGKRILPLSVLIEMAIAAAKISNPSKKLTSLRKNKMLKKNIIINKELDLYTIIKKVGNDQIVEIKDRDINGNIYFSCILKFDETIPVENRSVSREFCYNTGIQTIYGDVCYKKYEDRNIKFGEDIKVINRILKVPSQILTELKIRKDENKYYLNPEIVQAIMTIGGNDIEDNEKLNGVYIEEIVLIKPIDKVCYGLVRKITKNTEELNMLFMDLEGDTLVKLNNVRLENYENQYANEVKGVLKRLANKEITAEEAKKLIELNGEF